MHYASIYPIQIRITVVWLIFSALLILRNIFIISESPELSSVVWSWFSTSILPASGLIFGLWLSVINNGLNTDKIPCISANIAQGVVYFYIAMVLTSIVIETIYGSKTPQAHYVESQKWLAFIQAPMLAFLGKIFAERTNTKKAGNEA